jgi:hypothetical protein
MTLITRTAKGSKLTIAEMDGNLTYLEQLAQQGGGLEGTQYLFVTADGTDVENAAELQAAYDAAKTMSPSADNRITVVAAPGNYKFPSTFVMDTEYIDLVSLTGNRDVIFDLEGITDPFQFDPITFDIISIGECLLIDTDNVFVKGIKGKFYLSPNLDEWYYANDGLNQDYILPIQVSDNLPNIVVENCNGGIFSFGGDYTYNNPINTSGTFINCEGREESFGSGLTPGTFINCKSKQGSFGGLSGEASGVFENCKSERISFGGLSGEASGTFLNCDSNGDSSFGGFLASGIFINCQSANDSFGGSFGATLTGKLYYCRLTLGTFPTVSGSGVTVLCIDGNNAINTQN